MYENTFTFLNTALFEIRLPLQTNIVELALESCVCFCLSLVVWSLFFLSPELKNLPQYDGVVTRTKGLYFQLKKVYNKI